MKGKWLSIYILGFLAFSYGYGLPEFFMERGPGKDRNHGREKQVARIQEEPHGFVAQVMEYLRQFIEKKEPPPRIATQPRAPAPVAPVAAAEPAAPPAEPVSKLAEPPRAPGQGFTVMSVR
ncbi:MAG: hypothetical protein IOC52_02280 [Methylobacterium sp.]|nr:hypothetical protein [Methylobacterium sp.]